MRYESKHYYFKKQLKSFKNVTKTLANKHQMTWPTSLASTIIKKGPGKMVALCDVNEGDNIALYFNVLHSVPLIYSHSNCPMRGLPEGAT